jgi:hypothetical protein
MNRLVILGLLPLNVYASDLLHRDHVIGIALVSSMYEASPNLLWLSNFKFGSEKSPTFTDAAGIPIAGNPSVVSSAYDQAVSYNVSNMYAQRNRRVTFVANYASDQPGLIYSFGFDSGVETAKLQIKQSFFLGLTKAFRLSPQSHLAIGSGAWFGGSISESPCVDNYDRSYYCQNLTAWADYQPRYPQQQRYVDIKYLYSF